MHPRRLGLHGWALLLGLAGLSSASATASSLAVNGAASFAGSFGLEVTLASSCTDPHTLAVSGGSESGTATHTACEDITADSYTIAGTGDVTFEAGRRIALASGFTVASGGSFEARIDPSLDPSAFVEDRSPQSESAYNLRFYLRLDGASLGSGRFDHFVGYSTDGTQQFRLVLLRNEVINPPENRLVLEARLDDGSFATTEGTAEVEIEDGWHAVEISFGAAAPGASDGSLQLWVDDVDFGGLASLDNDLARINRVRWGAVSGLDAATTGTMHLDEMVSQRAGHIGLLP